MLVVEFENIFYSKINILLQMVSWLQFLRFSSKASEMHMLFIFCFIIATFPTLSIPPKFPIRLWV
jgi:hypothetical protein